MQVRQIAGMRGLVANPKGEIIPRPIKANFREGLSVLEYFISTHGARKGLADTALRTADSGLPDPAPGRRLPGRDHPRGRLRHRARRHACAIAARRPRRRPGRRPDDVETSVLRPHPRRGRRGATARSSARRGVDLGDVLDRRRWSTPGSRRSRSASVLTCESKVGTCATCYGRSLATGKLVDVGEAVGIIAAQSIGEPGTQLTMRTFHTGGVAGEDITHGLPRVVELFEARTPKGVAPISEADRPGPDRGHRQAPQDRRGPRRRSEEIAYPVVEAVAAAGRRRRPRRGRPAAGRRRGRPARGAADPRPARRAAAPGRRGPGGLPLAGRVDPRQAHRGHRPADAQAGERSSSRATPSCCPASSSSGRGSRTDNRRVRGRGRRARPPAARC